MSELSSAVTLLGQFLLMTSVREQEKAAEFLGSEALPALGAPLALPGTAERHGQGSAPRWGARHKSERVAPFLENGGGIL